MAKTPITSDGQRFQIFKEIERQPESLKGRGFQALADHIGALFTLNYPMTGGHARKLAESIGVAEFYLGRQSQAVTLQSLAARLDRLERDLGVKGSLL